MLILLGGRPASGKTSLASHLIRPLETAYIDLATIDAGLGGATLAIDPADDLASMVAFGLARDNLSHGRSVLVECINPTEASLSSWRTVAAQTDQPIMEIEVLCSDEADYRRRVQARLDANAYTPAAFEQMASRRSTWSGPRFPIDTAKRDPASCAAEIIASAWMGHRTR